MGYAQQSMVEIFFPRFKPRFDEVVSAKEFERMVAEIGLKVYNLMLDLSTCPALLALPAADVR